MLNLQKNVCSKRKYRKHKLSELYSSIHIYNWEFFCRIELDSDKWHRWQDVEVQADNITVRKQEQETVQK